MPPVAGIAEVHNALDRFQETREGARRFHGDIIGRDIDPEHCFADWLSLVRDNNSAAIQKKYWAKVEKGALNEVSATAGGYTVPPSLSLDLMRDLSTGSLMRRHGAYVQPMQTLQCHLPVPDVSTVQAAGVAPYFGGFLMSWLSQSDQNTYPATGMNFRNVVLTAWDLGGYVYASNSFLMDAAGVNAWLVRLFANGAAWYQDLAFFAGSGVGQPQGVIGCSGAATVTRATGANVKAADLQTMISKLLPSAEDDGAIFFCHPTVKAQFNGTNFPNWIPNGKLRFNGVPIVSTGKCSTLGTKGDIILVTPSLYIIGDRQQVEVAFSTEEPTAWKHFQSAFRVKSRVDGQPAVAAPITLQDASSQVSPYVVLV